MLFETEVVACICHSPLHPPKPDFEGQSVIKASSYLLPFVLEAHRESLPRSCETSARRLSAESAEVYSTADLPASAAHLTFSVISTSLKVPCFSRLAISLFNVAFQRSARGRPMASLKVFGIPSDSPLSE